VPGVLAAIVHDVTSARMARQHNDANVLCVGARLLGPQVAADTVDAFLEADFEGGRHQRRIDRITELEDQDGGDASVASAMAGGADDELFDIIAREVERQNTGPGSPSTRTRSRATPARPSSPAACASAPPRSPPREWGPTR